MTSFKFDMSKRVNSCIKSLEINNYDNSGLWKIIAPSTITINDVTLKKCYTCKMYIHQKRIYKHMTSKCPPPNYYLKKEYYKGIIECECGTILLQKNYSKHLLTPTHINYWEKYSLYKPDGVYLD